MSKLKNISLLFGVLILVTLLCSCAKEVRSETEARRVLLSAFTEISEIEKSMEELDEDYLNEQSVKNLRKRLNKCYNNILSTKDYYPVESVKEQYDKAEKAYSKLDKKLTKVEKALEEQLKDRKTNK